MQIQSKDEMSKQIGFWRQNAPTTISVLSSFFATVATKFLISQIEKIWLENGNKKFICGDKVTYIILYKSA